MPRSVALYLNVVRALRTVLLGAALSLGVVSGAAAGPLEELRQLAEGPGGSTRRVLRYIYGGDGLVLSDDGGASWRALCADAVRPAGWDRPPVKLGRTAIDGSGFLYVATFAGLVRDDGAGCGWASEPALDGKWVTDVVVHPSDPDVLFAVTSDGGAMPDNGVFRRDGNGIWQEIGTRAPVLIDRVRAVELPSGDLRLYVGGVNGMYGTPPDTRPRYVVRYSDDLGETWTEYERPETDGTFVLEAVDPSDPDRIVASLQFAAHEGPLEVPHEVLVSEDRGETFTTYVELTQFGGVDFAPDGRVWIGDRGDSFAVEAPFGLFHAASLGEAPTKIDDSIPVSCVHHVEGDQVFVCQPYEAGSFGEAEGYARSFAFREVTDFVACGAVAAACRDAYNGAWCGASHFPTAPMCCAYPDRQGVDAGACEALASDAGPAADAGGADAGGTDSHDDGGCGCRAGQGRPPSTPLGMLGVVLSLLVCVRAARRRSPARRAA